MSGRANKPIGSRDVPLQQEAAPPYALLITIAPGVALAVDVTDRPGRQLGIVYGNQDQLQQVPGTLELITQDTGLNTNPERWLHDNHWEDDEVTIAIAGAPGEQTLDPVVPAGETRRIRVLHVRHEGTNNTVLTLLVAGGAVKRSWDITAQSTRVISSEDGWEFDAGEQPAVQSSDVTGGSTYVGAEGVQSGNPAPLPNGGDYILSSPTGPEGKKIGNIFYDNDSKEVVINREE